MKKDLVCQFDFAGQLYLLLKEKREAEIISIKQA